MPCLEKRSPLGIETTSPSYVGLANASNLVVVVVMMLRMMMMMTMMWPWMRMVMMTRIRDAPISKKCSFFEHCSKGL